MFRDFPAYSYFVIDDDTRRGFLIDPGEDAKTLKSIISENGWTIEKMLLTHGHFDHFTAAETLMKDLGIPCFAPEKSSRYLQSPYWNLSAMSDVPGPITLQNVGYFRSGEKITLSSDPNFFLQTIAAPGHSEDSVIFYSEKQRTAYVGDIIFRGRDGVAHFPGSDAELLQETIRNVVLTLPADTRLLSGHTEATTVREERIRHRLPA